MKLQKAHRLIIGTLTMGIMAVTAQTNSAEQTANSKETEVCSICKLHKSQVGSKPAGGILSLTNPGNSPYQLFNDTISGVDSARVVK